MRQQAPGPQAAGWLVVQPQRLAGAKGERGIYITSIMMMNGVWAKVGYDRVQSSGNQSGTRKDRSRLNCARCWRKSESRDHRYPLLAQTRDNGVVYVPTAFAQQARFQAAVARAAQRLAPHVVSIIPTLGNDWSGEPAVFFMVILADAASRRDQLLNISNQVEQAIVQQVQPLEQWGVLPYFNFRSQSEQAKLNQPALV